MANSKSSNTIIHDTICLFLITLIAGILLGGIYMITKTTISTREEQAKKEAYEAVYEDASFSEDNEVNDKLADFQKNLTAGKVKTESGSDLSDVEISEVMVADKGGYVATCSGKGYGGAVTLALGIDADGKILGIQITDCTNETPGLGQNSSNAEWNGQYLGMDATQEISVVKDGSGSKEEGKVNAISGATITSSAVTRAVNGVLLFVKTLSQ